MTLRVAAVVLMSGCVGEPSGSDTDADSDTDVVGDGGDSDSDADTDADTDTGTDTGTGTGTGSGDGITNVDPSGGAGGDIAPGATGMTPLGAEIYVPASYDPETLASPAIWLFNETIDQWRAVADEDAVILVDLHEYNDIPAIVDKINESVPILEEEYNVDRARYYWAGWSAGGNIVIIVGSENQATLAGTMVFPGTGGNFARDSLEAWDGHKIRMFYACGDQDPNYDYGVPVEAEANAWADWFGYETRFEMVEGSAHYIDEGVYGIRATAWEWMRGFNLGN
jgi:predicted esterase